MKSFSNEALIANENFLSDLRNSGGNTESTGDSYRQQVLSRAKSLYQAIALRQLLYVEQHTHYLPSMIEMTDTTRGAS